MAAPRYILWDTLDCESYWSTLAEALDAKARIGGVVFEPLGLTAAEKACATQEDWEQFRNNFTKPEQKS